MRHLRSSRLPLTWAGVLALSLALCFCCGGPLAAAADTAAAPVAAPPALQREPPRTIAIQTNGTRRSQTGERPLQSLQRLLATEEAPDRRQERQLTGPLASRRHQRRIYVQERQKAAALRKTAAYAYTPADDFTNQQRYGFSVWDAGVAPNVRRPAGRASRDSPLAPYPQVPEFSPIVAASTASSVFPSLRVSRAPTYPESAWAASESSAYYYLPTHPSATPQYAFAGAPTQTRASRPPHRDTLSTTTSTADYGSYYSTRTTRKPRVIPFAKGDIDPEYQELVRGMPLSSFEGTWECLASRSGSADDILMALGVGYFKRNLFSRHCTEYTVHFAPDKKSFTAHTTLPWNRSISGTVLLDGTEFVNNEPETGDWNVKAYFIDGRVGQIRKNENGVMYDVRAVLPRDPYGEFSDSQPVMVFQWTYIPNGGTPYTVERWFVKSRS